MTRIRCVHLAMMSIVAETCVRDTAEVDPLAEVDAKGKYGIRGGLERPFLSPFIGFFCVNESFAVSASDVLVGVSCRVKTESPLPADHSKIFNRLDSSRCALRTDVSFLNI